MPFVLLPFPGPTIPLARPLPVACAVPKGSQDFLRDRVRELPGAVVPVEDSLPEPIVVVERNLDLIRGRLRVFLRNGVPGASSLPPWTDPTTVRSGGNVVHRSFPLGGVGF